VVLGRKRGQRDTPVVKKAPKGLFPVPPAQYGADYQRHLLDQYKLYVEMANAVSVRRTSANNYLLTINGFLVTLYGLAACKGVATATGVFLALAPVAVAIGLAVWLTVLSISGYVSLASILSAIIVPVVVLIVQGPGPVFALASAVALFVLFAHRANIKRLLRGEEHRFRRKTEPTR